MVEEKLLNEKKLFVVYVGVGDAGSEDQLEIMNAAKNTFADVIDSINAEGILLPTRTTETRVECLNPTYITDQELIRKHRLLMDELNEHLKYHVDNFKADKKD